MAVRGRHRLRLRCVVQRSCLPPLVSWPYPVDSWRCPLSSSAVNRFYLVAERHGWHRPMHRADVSFDCVQAVRDQLVMEWPSGLTVSQHAGLVQQWMTRAHDAPLSDEWIPTEWLLRVWDSPAMAAIEGRQLGTQTRLFEVDAEPVLLARSIPVFIPDLGLAGVDRFRVTREVPSWWLFGPCGREVQALLNQHESLATESPKSHSSTGPDVEGLRMRGFEIVDATGRGGAYTLAQAVISAQGQVGLESRLALDAAIGFMLKDIWSEAPRLYAPWVERHGLPDLASAADLDDERYPLAPVA